MHNFKKVVVSAFSFFVGIILISGLLIFSGDQKKQIKENIDFVICGASHAETSLIPEIIDRKLNVFSYNYSVGAMTMHGRYEMLKKAIKENDVKTVVFEISYDTLTRNEEEEAVEGDQYLIRENYSFFDGIKYIGKYNKLSFSLIQNIYGIYMKDSFERIFNLSDNPKTYSKGYYKNTVNDLSLSEQEARNSFNSTVLDADFREDSLEWLDKSVALCKDNSINFIMVVIPVSDAMLWQYSNWDEIINKIRNYCSEKECSFIDFNLLKDRFSLLNDHECFNDKNHISDKGAPIFTEAFCDVIYSKDNAIFFDNYCEMKKHSPYYRYIEN